VYYISFEAPDREGMSEMLNELQAAVLLLAQLQLKISKIGSYVENMSETVEELIAEKN
jgi:hypothetical protein